jgi:hypothetical protein
MCCENVVLSEVILTRISRFSNETSLNPDKHDWNIAIERPTFSTCQNHVQKRALGGALSVDLIGISGLDMMFDEDGNYLMTT